jgi:hypothetical protein
MHNNEMKRWPHRCCCNSILQLALRAQFGRDHLFLNRALFCCLPCCQLCCQSRLELDEIFIHLGTKQMPGGVSASVVLNGDNWRLHRCLCKTTSI